MTRKRLKQLAENPRHIEGVFNYCDRWCERCPLTDRCLNFAMGVEQEAEAAAEEDGATPDASKVWKSLGDSLRLTFEMIAEECRERGIDFAALQADASSEVIADKLAEKKRRRREHPLSVAAMDYLKRVDDWFKARKKTFRGEAEELEAMLRMELPGQDPAAAARDLRDAVEIVRWYYMFIGAKLARAVGQEEAGEEDDDGGETAMHDANGSAKVALIAMDRSLLAWARIRSHLPSEGDVIIDFLLELARLRQRTEATFPNARAFVRPGFDDGTLKD
jgi:hypothetical protein